LTARITLGGQHFVLPAVTIGKLEAIQSALSDKGASPIGQSVAVINAALAPAKIDDATPATLPELTEAMKDALKHAGFKLAEGAPGEAAAPAPTGA
jgi:hypothetical protein